LAFQVSVLSEEISLLRGGIMEIERSLTD